MTAFCAWKLARLFWAIRLDRLGDHFEDVAQCGKGWFGWHKGGAR